MKKIPPQKHCPSCNSAQSSSKNTKVNVLSYQSSSETVAQSNKAEGFQHVFDTQFQGQRLKCPIKSNARLVAKI